MTQEAESTANVSEVNEQPTQTQQGASQVSQSSLDVKAIAAEVANILKPEFQSIKDKRLAKFEQFIKEFSNPQAGDVEQNTADPTPQGKATAQPVTTTPVQEKPVGKQVDFDEAEAVILKQFGLSNDDPAVVAAKALDPVLRIVEYGKIVERRNEKANLAAATAVGGGAPVGKDALADELMKLQRSDPFDKSGRQAAIMQQLGIT